MKFFVKVKTNSNRILVEKKDSERLLVSVNKPPAKNQANRVLIEALAEYFDVAVSRIKIISGQKTKNKIIEIND